MPLVKCRDVVKEGLIFLFARVLFVGRNRVDLPLSGLHDEPCKNSLAVAAPPAEISQAGRTHAGNAENVG